MDYFLKLYDINNWKDYIIKSFQQPFNNDINVLIIACLFKLHPSDLILTDESIYQIKKVFVELKLCDKDIKNQDLIVLINNCAKKYIDNPNEELLFASHK